MSATPGFRRKTLKLPCRTAAFCPGAAVDGHRIGRILSIDAQKTVCLLTPEAVLCVRHNSRRLPPELLQAMTCGAPGLVRITAEGTLEGCWYSIDEHLQPLPPWSSLTDARRRTLAAQMAAAVNALHDLGLCHLDLTSDHFRLDAAGQVRLIDLDSAQPYDRPGKMPEYTPEFAAPEVFEGRFTTASDFYALGKVLAAWAGAHPLVPHLTAADPDRRYNYVQLTQSLAGASPEPFTGPRTYIQGVPVGTKTAWSDRQLARYLSENYPAAVAHVRRTLSLSAASDAARVARRIHALDPDLPLYWEGRRYASTRDIAAVMARAHPRKDAQMLDLLRSGILLSFSQITGADASLQTLLRDAAQDPDRHYWAVSQAFGGPVVRPTPAPSLTDLSRKRGELELLVSSRLLHGDPVTVASVLQSIPASPTAATIDAVLRQLRAIPVREAENRSNVTFATAFGRYIETRLPEPGHHPADAALSDLFDAGTLYLISLDAFEAWQEANDTQRRARRARNRSIWKAVGWTAAGAALLAALPYILAGLLVIGIIVLIFSIL